MKEKNSPSALVSETNSPEANHSSIEEGVQRHWQGIVKRRSFLKGLGMAGATLSARTLLPTHSSAQSRSRNDPPSRGDAPPLQLPPWAGIVASELWTQYAELGASRAPLGVV